MRKARMCVMIVLALLLSLPVSAAIKHRYDFAVDANDVVGGLETTLESGAVLQDGALVLAGGSPGARAVLDGPGIAINGYTDGVSLEFWYTANALSGWTRVFDFGDTSGSNGGYYLFYTPSGPGNSRLVIGTLGFPGWQTGEQFVNGPTLTTATTYHIVCIYDPDGGTGTNAALKIYQNGELANSNVNVTQLLSNVHNAYAYLGSAVYPGDPELNGSIAEFRIYDKPLSAAEVRFTNFFGSDNAYPIVLRSLTPVYGDESVNAAAAVELAWTPEPDITADSYTLYYGVDPNILDPNCADLTGRGTAVTGIITNGYTIAAETLDYLTQYYWRVDTIVGTTTYQGVGTTFTTLPDSPYFIYPDPEEVDSVVTVADETAAISVTVNAGNTNTYRWYKEGDSATTLSTTDTLAISDVNVLDEGNFYCEISHTDAPTVIVTSVPFRMLARRLIGHWKFEGNLEDSVDNEISGAVAHDGVLKVHDTIAGPGDPNYASEISETGIDGDAGWFYNDGDYIEIPDSDYFNYYHEGLTISCWYLMDELAGWTHPIIKLESGVSTASGYLFGVDGNNRQANVFIFENALAWPGLNSDDGSHDVNYRDGQWHLMTATYDAATNTARLYADGYLVDEGTPSFGTLGYPNATVKLGGSNLSGNYGIQGGLDDVRIYTYALSGTEVAELYTDMKTTEYVCVEDEANPLTYDVNDDCRVNLLDILELAQWWLECQRIPDGACEWSL